MIFKDHCLFQLTEWIRSASLTLMYFHIPKRLGSLNRRVCNVCYVLCSLVPPLACCSITDSYSCMSSYHVDRPNLVLTV